jgi:hypothetical protein
MGVLTAAADGAVRGAVAAMAMSGLRTVTTGFGLVARTPPEAITVEGAPELLRAVPGQNRQATVELLHWAYGAVGGVAFRLLPAAVRRHRLAGPAYGALVWLGFEAGIAPALGLPESRQSRPVERLMVLADHVLYGMVVAAAERKRARVEAAGGVPARELSDEDLARELTRLYSTRDDALRHGSAQALERHTSRTEELEAEYLRRFPDREVDPERLRKGARRRHSARDGR